MERTMTTYSIGYYREDGDFAILATLNNNDGHYSPNRFNRIVSDMIDALEINSEEIIALERQDTPDYITIEKE